jgi:heme exporter protein D
MNYRRKEKRYKRKFTNTRRPSMVEFLAMGGYAFFVWSSYGLSLLVLALTFIWPVLQKRRLLQKLKQAHQRKSQLARRQQ